MVCLCESSTVAGERVPPFALTCIKPDWKFGVYTITSAAPHVPPRGLFTSARATIEPPLDPIRLSFVGVKNPIDFPSGDQNGCIAPSVPSNRFAVKLSSERTHNDCPGIELRALRMRSCLLVVKLRVRPRISPMESNIKSGGGRNFRARHWQFSI